MGKWLTANLNYAKEEFQLLVGAWTQKPILQAYEAVLDETKAVFIVADRSDLIQKRHRSGRFYEPGELRHMLKHFRGGTFLDVGTNVGNHAIFFAKQQTCSQVIAIEPNPDALFLLKLNLQANHLRSKVELHECALGAKSSKLQIHTPRGNLGGAHIVASGAVDADTEKSIPVVTGESLLDGRIVDFIKMDVEGFEIEALRGLDQTIRRCRPTLFIEVQNENRSALNALVKDWDYHEPKCFSRYGDSENLLLVPKVIS